MRKFKYLHIKLQVTNTRLRAKTNTEETNKEMNPQAAV